MRADGADEVELLYFAYGSNLHPERLRERIGSAILVSTGEMRGARLRFHKVGQDGSGKCSVVMTGELEEAVLGAIYRLTRDQLGVLDGFESLGRGYRRCRTAVRLPRGGSRRCSTYVAMAEFVDERLVPYSWYTELVALGARYHGFPEEYVAKLERQPAVADPDARRSAEERGRMARMRRAAGP